MKKMAVFLAGMCLLFGSLGIKAQAAGASIAAGYGMEDEVCAFYETDRKDEKEQISLILNEKQVSGPGALSSPVRMSESGQTLHCFLLIDRSTSMKKYEKQVEAFALTLLEEMESRTDLTLLSLGDAFAAELERATDRDAVSKKLAEIECDEERTDLYQGIWSALDYLERQDRKQGDLFVIILLSDGVPYEAAGEPDAGQVTERIEGSKDSVFVTLRLGNWTEEAADFAPGLGFYEAKTVREAEAEAQEFAERLDGMYAVRFALNQTLTGSALDMKLFLMNAGEALTMHGAPVLDESGRPAAGKERSDTASGDSGSETAGGAETEAAEGGAPGSAGEDETEAAEESGAAGEDGAEAAEEGTPGSAGEDGAEAAEEGTPGGAGEDETEAAEGGAPGGTGEDETKVAEEKTPDGAGEDETGAAEEESMGPAGETSESGTIAFGEEETAAAAGESGLSALLKRLPWLLPLFSGLAAGAAIAALLFALFGRKRRTKAASGGIRLRVEIVSGRCRTRKREFYPEQAVLIGTAEDCTLIWEEETVSAHHARIFVRDGLVYVEDLGSVHGTAVGGMRIYGPNRLRNGDLVSVGRAAFRVLL